MKLADIKTPDFAMKVLHKRGVMLWIGSDGRLKARHEDGTKPDEEEIQVVMKHRDALKRLCTYDGDAAVDVISAGIKKTAELVGDHPEGFVQWIEPWMDKIDEACGAGDGYMGEVRRHVADMIRQARKLNEGEAGKESA